MQARELVVGLPHVATEQKPAPELTTPVRALDKEGNVYEVYAMSYDPENKCFFLHLASE